MTILITIISVCFFLLAVISLFLCESNKQLKSECRNLQMENDVLRTWQAMSKPRYFIYGNSGTIWETKNRLETGKEDRYNSLFEVLQVLIKKHELDGVYAFGIEDLIIKFYAADERIGKDVYMICTKRYFKEHYKNPQFISYLVEV